MLIWSILSYIIMAFIYFDLLKKEELTFTHFVIYALSPITLIVIILGALYTALFETFSK